MRYVHRRVLSLLVLLVSLPVSSIELSPLTHKPYKGDWPILKEKGAIRVVVSADLGFYYVEAGRPKGIGAEFLHHFEKSLKKQAPYVYVQIIPVRILIYLPRIILASRLSVAQLLDMVALMTP